MRPGAEAPEAETVVALGSHRLGRWLQTDGARIGLLVAIIAARRIHRFRRQQVVSCRSAPEQVRCHHAAGSTSDCPISSCCVQEGVVIGVASPLGAAYGMRRAGGREALCWAGDACCHQLCEENPHKEGDESDGLSQGASQRSLIDLACLWLLMAHEYSALSRLALCIPHHLELIQLEL